MSARAELRKMIVRRLSTDEWMERHFGIVAHAEDVADSVMELFDIVIYSTDPRIVAYTHPKEPSDG